MSGWPTPATVRGTRTRPRLRLLGDLTRVGRIRANYGSKYDFEKSFPINSEHGLRHMGNCVQWSMPSNPIFIDHGIRLTIDQEDRRSGPGSPGTRWNRPGIRVRAVDGITPWPTDVVVAPSPNTTRGVVGSGTRAAPPTSTRRIDCSILTCGELQRRPHPARRSTSCTAPHVSSEVRCN